MSNELCEKMEIICSIAKYFLNTDNLMFSSGDDGFDKVWDAYCFFQGSLTEYKTYFIFRDYVEQETPLEVAIRLCDLIGNS